MDIWVDRVGECLRFNLDKGNVDVAFGMTFN